MYLCSNSLLVVHVDELLVVRFKSSAETIIISPAVVGFNSDGLTDIPIKITNKSGSTQTITVTVTLLKMEA